MIIAPHFSYPFPTQPFIPTHVPNAFLLYRSTVPKVHVFQPVIILFTWQEKDGLLAAVVSLFSPFACISFTVLSTAATISATKILLVRSKDDHYERVTHSHCAIFGVGQDACDIKDLSKHCRCFMPCV